MNQPKSLQSGTGIDDYEIKETLWTTSSGFIYRATDLDRERDVLIQEYLPAALATRHWSGIHAMALEGLAEEFDQGLTRFLREARILAQIHDPYVCRVYEYTEANATAYMVLDYEPGQTLQAHLATRTSPLDEGEIRKLLVPLLKGLRVAHASELLHRDIHPANIYLREVGPPVLIGFGSPEITVHEGGDPHVENRVAPGYTPVEQYQSDGEVGPWTDLYALSATMYRCLSGMAPVDAARRVTEIAQGKEDPLVPATELGVSDYSSGLLGAIDWMLEPMVADRPDSAGAVLGPLTEERAPHRPAPSTRPNVPASGIGTEATKPQRGRRARAARATGITARAAPR
jgi:serine/threonine protein kinase